MADIYTFLAEHGIEYVKYEHPPVMTCDEEKLNVPESGAARTKNLLLRDRKGKRHLLLVTLCTKTVSIAAFADIAAADRLSFASPERLKKHLGVEPGAVTVLGLINDPGHAVEVFVDADVWNAAAVHAHPLRNDATLVITHDALVRFLAATGHEHRVVTIRIS